MSKYGLSPRARIDLDEIWDYTEKNWSAAQAETYIRGIQAAIETAASDPKQGRRCDDVRAGYMKIPAGSHMVFYRRAGKGIEVVRILHQRMDFASHF